MQVFAFSRPSVCGAALILLTLPHCVPGVNPDSAADRARWANRAAKILKKAPPPGPAKPAPTPKKKAEPPRPAADRPGRSPYEKPPEQRAAEKPAPENRSNAITGNDIRRNEIAPREPSARAPRNSRRESPRQYNVTPETVFADAADDRTLFSNHRRRWKVFRNPRVQKRYNTRRTRGTVAIQYSDHKRLFDHNILLAALFEGRLHNGRVGNLKEAFHGALFFDLGSAILYKQGAVTVRAIHEDKRVMPFLSKLVASDINDYRSSRTEFINIYRKNAKPLPFPVEEIDMSITRPVQVEVMLKPYLRDTRTPVILRTVNTGIDYYYSESQLRRHFQAVLMQLAPRNVIYLFNRYVLFKPADTARFLILGEIAPLFRAEKQRGRKIWRRINWKKRKLKDGFTPRPGHLRIVSPPGSQPKPKSEPKGRPKREPMPATAGKFSAPL